MLAPTTPARKQARSTMTKDVGASPKELITPRKQHRCTKCKRPRAGHPRQGCPYVDSSGTDTDAEGPRTDSKGEDGEEAIINAISSLNITPSGVKSNGDGVAYENAVVKRSKRRSSVQPGPSVTVRPDPALAFPPPILGVMGERPLAHGTTDDEERQTHEERKKAGVTKRQETMSTPARSTSSKKIEKGKGTMLFDNAGLQQRACLDLVPDHEAKPLIRSMSFEERHAFIGGVVEASKIAPATVFVLSSKDALAVQSSAKDVGFYTKTLESRNGTDDVWLILGTDDAAVMHLFDNLKDQRARDDKGGRGSLGAAAGGVVVGAMATWTGLAFA